MNSADTPPTHLFWDIDQDTLDLNKHKRFIIERILQYGRPEDIKWVLDHYSEEDIIDTVKRSKIIDRKTATYWSIHYHIPKKEILCLNRPLIQDCFY
jgi:tagatose-1,6-bisphosphate aldolase